MYAYIQMRCTTLYPLTKDSHNTGNFMPYSFRIVCGLTLLTLNL